MLRHETAVVGHKGRKVLEMAYVLEWAAILLVGLARNGAGFDSGT